MSRIGTSRMSCKLDNFPRVHDFLYDDVAHVVRGNDLSPLRVNILDRYSLKEYRYATVRAPYLVIVHCDEVHLLARKDVFKLFIAVKVFFLFYETSNLN